MDNELGFEPEGRLAVQVWAGACGISRFVPPAEKHALRHRSIGSPHFPDAFGVCCQCFGAGGVPTREAGHTSRSDGGVANGVSVTGLEIPGYRSRT